MKVRVCGLLSGMGIGVIRWLQHLAEQSALPAATRTRLEQIHGYFERHRDRIRYDRYLAAGYPIASGVIEGACRHVVKDRIEINFSTGKGKYNANHAIQPHKGRTQLLY